MSLTRQQISNGLRKIGLKAGMKVMVHSSLRSFGRVQGGAQTVIDALQEVITPAGTIMMPSFNHGSIFETGESGVYDPESSPTTNGLIPQLFWQSPGVYRSLNPTHAFACWGKNAQSYIENHHRTLTMAPDSPLGLLARVGGHGLLLGVDYNANTLHHVAEFANNAPCLGYRTRSYPVRLPDGRLVKGRTWSFRANPCPITDKLIYTSRMKERRLERTGTIGLSQVTLFKLDDCLEVVLELLQNGIGDVPPCHQCLIRPLTGTAAATSDWDHVKNKLLPSSSSWEF